VTSCKILHKGKRLIETISSAHLAEIASCFPKSICIHVFTAPFHIVMKKMRELRPDRVSAQHWTERIRV
jgi:hypothetical protein